MVMVGGPFGDIFSGFNADIQTIIASLQVVRVSLFSFSWGESIKKIIQGNQIHQGTCT